MTEADDRSHALTPGAITGAAAAVMHGAAIGIHADEPDLARLFIALAIAQGAVALVALARPGRFAAGALVAVNLTAAGGWLVTRTTGISWIGGLEVAESPQLADTIAAAFALIAVAVGAAVLSRPLSPPVPGRAIAGCAVVTAALLVPGLVDVTTHDHGDHATDDEPAADHGHDDDDHDHDGGGDHGADGGGDHGVTDDDTTGSAGGSGEGAAAPSDAASIGGQANHEQDPTTDDHATHPDETGRDQIAWPRAWDPTEPIDFGGVDGVNPDQQARAEQLVADTLRELPAFSDVDQVARLGYRSIGDASTGHEHYINISLIDDEHFLDPTAPESLVYAVDGDRRTLVSAMFIAGSRPIDDPTLTDFAGPLMQWHVHDNLCWGLGADGRPVVVRVLERAGESCPAGSVRAGGDHPMVHVWIAPHPCGPFAALEGHGAGQAAVSDGARMDLCAHDDHDVQDATGTATVPYDPELPIDLGGVEGVTPQQQAFAENLVAATVRDLPQWADPAVAEAAGFRSIGDGFTGHEHYIQWDWIDDDVWLDPDHPESLVFEPQPDGSKRLVSAMFMLPSGTALDEVPDWGGPLMQWHVHGDLCFTDDQETPRVAGVKPVGGTCAPPLVDGTMAPMIHVWIRPHECGPFAALDGIAGGQVPDGEAVSCDHAHGSS